MSGRGGEGAVLAMAAPGRAVSWRCSGLHAVLIHRQSASFRQIGNRGSPHAASHSPALPGPVALGMAGTRRAGPGPRLHRHALCGLTVRLSERAIVGGDALDGVRQTGALSFFYLPSAGLPHAPLGHAMLWPMRLEAGQREGMGGDAVPASGFQNGASVKAVAFIHN